MNRVEFMNELEYLLQDIPAEEKADALEYYRDYLEEAGDENEEQAIREFGSPERVAAIIRTDLNGHLEDGGGFTEAGYQDERFHDPRYQVVEHRNLPEVAEETTQAQTEAERDFQKRQPHRDNQSLVGKLLKLGLILILLCFCVPLVLSLGSGALAVILAAISVIIVVVLLVGLLTLGACIGAVAVFVLGIGLMFTNPWSGLLMLGVAVLLLGLALIGIALSILVYLQFLPFCIRGIVNLLSRLLHRDWRKRK